MEVKKAIVLDMDNTLECGVRNNSPERNYTMFLRPGIDEVVEKLKQAKERKIDIILCTTGNNKWVERFLSLKPEFRELFTKIYSRDNQREWQEIISYEEFPIESTFWNPNGKPVTTWGYNSVLFIDDAPGVKDNLEKIYADNTGNREGVMKIIQAFSKFLPDEICKGRKYDKDDLAKAMKYLPENILSKFPSKKIDTTFFNIPFYNIDYNEITGIFDLLNDPNISSETREKIIQKIRHIENDPGCRMICEEVDKFMEKEFAPGLTMAEKNHEQELKSYRAKAFELRWLPDTSYKCPQAVFDEYMSQDRKGPYEGILPEVISINSAVNSLIRQEGVIENIGNDGTEKKENEQNAQQTGEQK